MKALILRLFRLFGKYIGLGILLFITGALYFVVFRDGIDTFYYPMVGLFSALFMPMICAIYYFTFIRK